MRTYELVVVYDPRVADDEVGTLTGEVKNLLTAPGGVTVTKTEHWGRRRLAYPIQKVNEGKYAVVYFAAEDGTAPIAEVERRLLQNDRVLRFLTTRTDEGLKRAGLPIPTEVEPDQPPPGGEDEGEGGGGERESRKAAAPEPADKPEKAEPVAEPSAEPAEKLEKAEPAAEPAEPAEPAAEEPKGEE